MAGRPFCGVLLVSPAGGLLPAPFAAAAARPTLIAQGGDGNFLGSTSAVPTATVSGRK
jgi:hypothetical protein